MKNKAEAAAICKYAIASRCLVAILIILWRTVIPPYDTSSSINPPCIIPHRFTNAPNPSLRYSQIGSAIQNSVVWDSVYFLRIAECGYEYEQTYAFFPLLPLLITFISRAALFPLIPLIGYRAVLTLAGYIVCNSAFIISAAYFYRLSEIVLKNKNAAFRASVLFCFNPASIFYSSIYSESLYALLFIGGLCYFLSGSANKATFWWSLSSFARSNGVINVGYFCYQAVQRINDILMGRKRVSVKLYILPLRCLCVLAPFLAYQTYGYFKICFINANSPWCTKKLPLMYNYIQSEYWGVGFLRYYQLKQLPNFLLASPILSLAISSIVHFVRKNREDFYALVSVFRAKTVGSEFGLHKNNSKLAFVGNLRSRKSFAEEISEKGGRNEEIPSSVSIVVPCVFHLGFMVSTAALFMHVQVATRFLSASPPIYWYAAHLMGNLKHLKWSHLIWAYSFVYVLIGSLLFSTFYPFT